MSCVYVDWLLAGSFDYSRSNASEFIIINNMETKFYSALFHEFLYGDTFERCENLVKVICFRIVESSRGIAGNTVI